MMTLQYDLNLAGDASHEKVVVFILVNGQEGVCDTILHSAATAIVHFTIFLHLLSHLWNVLSTLEAHHEVHPEM